MSESFLDLGYTSPDDAVRYKRMRARTISEPASSAEKNRRARRIEEQHAHDKERGMLMPDAATLDNMTADQKAEIIDGIRGARAALEAAKLGVQQTVEVAPQDQVEQFVQDELPFQQ